MMDEKEKDRKSPVFALQGANGRRIVELVDRVVDGNLAHHEHTAVGNLTFFSVDPLG